MLNSLGKTKNTFSLLSFLQEHSQQRRWTHVTDFQSGLSACVFVYVLVICVRDRR